MAVVYRQRSNPLLPTLTNLIPPALETALPSGLSIPLKVVNNQWLVKSGVKKLEQDMANVLLTPVGRRLIQPDYGSLLPYLIFEAWGPALQQEMVIATQTALNTWVPAIIVQQVIIDASSIQIGKVALTIQYNVKGTAAAQTLVINLDAANTTQIPPSSYTIGGSEIPVLRV